MNPLIAFLGALGVWLVYTALTHPISLRIARLTTPRLAREAAEMRLRDYGGVTILGDKPLLDRALGPILESWAMGLAGLLGKPERDKR